MCTWLQHISFNQCSVSSKLLKGIPGTVAPPGHTKMTKAPSLLSGSSQIIIYRQIKVLYAWPVLRPSFTLDPIESKRRGLYIRLREMAFLGKEYLSCISGQQWELSLCVYSWAFWTQEIVHMKVQGWEMPWNHQKVGYSSLFPISRRKKWCVKWSQKACNKFLYFSCPKPLKPRESIRKTSSLCIISFRWFTIINTFICVEYNINGKSLFWSPPTEWGG